MALPQKGIVTELETFSRGPADTSSDYGKDFSQIQFPMTFKAPVPISVVGVSFFGPHSTVKGRCNYDVSIAIVESFANNRPGRMQKFMAEKWFKMNSVTPQEKFTVTLPQEVFVPKEMWVDILFQLEGPRTEFLHQNFIFQTEIKAGGTTFETLRGSSQLSDFFFQI